MERVLEPAPADPARAAPGPPARPGVTARPRLGEMLVSSGIINETQLADALEAQEKSGRRLGDVLCAQGLVTQLVIVRVLADYLGIEFVDLESISIDETVTGLIPEPLARRRNMLPIGLDDDRLVVAFANPADVLGFDDAQTASGMRVKSVMVDPGQLSAAIDRAWRQSPLDASELGIDEDFTGMDLTDEPVVESVEDGPVIRFVDAVIRQAVDEGASDIHIEPERDALRVRFRIDGVLHEVTRAPKSLKAGVISRIKVMAGLDIADRRRPQDGRFTLTSRAGKVDVRTASLPTTRGEAITMRLLSRNQKLPELDELGFLPEARDRFETALSHSSGTVLVTGPTGSGKSTTLYGVIGRMRGPSRNVVTVEDPVEYEMDGVRQVQVHPRAGLTFATALRALLRADPDVILVGEIRDAETATVAIEAALTGHLVLSTLHTRDSSSAPLRLVEMGVAPYLVNAALDAVVAQRLARRVCPHCATTISLDEGVKVLADLGASEAVMEAAGEIRLLRAEGCAHCHQTGYRGRSGLYEVMLLSEEIAHLIGDRAPSGDIRKVAIAQGMMSLLECGMWLALDGQTTIEEALRVVG